MRCRGRIAHSLLLVLLSGGVLMVLPAPSAAAQIRVAVASNFKNAMVAIIARFEAVAGHRVSASFGATGKHYAQIKNGAPFDVFFAADTRRPERLEREGSAVPGTRFTYAVGKLILWSPEKGYVGAGAEVLESGEFRHMAIANPKLAPYGEAARAVLRALGAWDRLRGRLVRGENIGQAFQFVKSGNAELGFVAYAQLKRPNQAIEGSFWEPPQALYTPIEQQAVLLRENDTAGDFLSFVRSDEGLRIIRDYGYATP